MVHREAAGTRVLDFSPRQILQEADPPHYLNHRGDWKIMGPTRGAVIGSGKKTKETVYGCVEGV